MGYPHTNTEPPANVKAASIELPAIARNIGLNRLKISAPLSVNGVLFEIKKQNPDFNHRDYGFETMKDLLAAYPEFRVFKKPNNIWYIEAARGASK